MGQATVKRFVRFLLVSVIVGSAAAVIGYYIPENHPDDRKQNTIVLGLSSWAFAMLICYLFSMLRRNVFSKLDATLLFSIPFLAVFSFWCVKGGNGYLGGLTIYAIIGMTIYIGWKLIKTLTLPSANDHGE